MPLVTSRRFVLGASLVVVGLALFSQMAAFGQQTNRAGLVIRHGDGRTVSRCVEFSEESISGYDLLAKSGLDLGIEASAMGAAICRLDNEGCTYPADACFCQCFGAPCYYWSYWRLADAGWQYSSIGASNTTVRHGQVEGWSWSTGAIGTTADSYPPALSYTEICEPQVVATQTAAAKLTADAQQPTATATPTATSTATTLPATATSTPTSTPSAIPSSTSTSRPAASTSTPLPSATPTPSETPTITATPQPVPIIVRFEADRAAITFGEPLALTWAVVDAQSVVLQLPDGEHQVEPQGSWTGTPNRTSVVTLVARGVGGDAVASLRIDVAPVFATPTPVPATAAPATAAPATAAESSAATAMPPPVAPSPATPVPSSTSAPPSPTPGAPTAVAQSVDGPAATVTPAAPSPLQVAAADAMAAPAVVIVITPPGADAAASPTLAPVAIVIGGAGAAAAPRTSQEAARVDGQPVLLALIVLTGLVVAGGAATLGAVIYLWMNRYP